MCSLACYSVGHGRREAIFPLPARSLLLLSLKTHNISKQRNKKKTTTAAPPFFSSRFRALRCTSSLKTHKNGSIEKKQKKQTRLPRLSFCLALLGCDAHHFCCRDANGARSKRLDIFRAICIYCSLLVTTVDKTMHACTAVVPTAHTRPHTAISRLLYRYI